MIMCLNPRKIKSPIKEVNLLGGQPLYIEVPCNQCAECKKNKRLEWRFRSFHECKSTLAKGGYIYFDTLTYSDEFIPKLSDYVDIMSYGIDDFTCFNHTHFRNFLKNLRRQLFYHYKGVTFKYFLSSEYGTDDRFTHRPHYHILFFISGRLIDPCDFSALVAKCWQFGRTDGIPYKTRDYVIEHSYGYYPNEAITGNKNLSVMTLCNYVSKYVTKDSTFQKEIEKRLQLLSSFLNEDDLKLLKRNVTMFNRQSQGFGISYLSSIDKDEYNFIFNNSACRLQDSDKITLTIPLPLYYKRKLFYKAVKDIDGSLRWLLTSRGKEFKENYLLSCIEKVVKHFNTIALNNPTSLRTIESMLNGRRLEDFAIYKLFYKGRCRNLINIDFSKLPLKTELTDTEYSLYDWLQILNYNDCEFELSFFRDRENNLIDIPIFYSDLFNPQTNTYRYETFVKHVQFNENTCIAFTNFDKLDVFFKTLTITDNKQKQLTFDFIEDLEKRFKIIYYE